MATTSEMAANAGGAHDPGQAQREIVAEFGLFTEWLDRYQYLIDLGRQLPALADSERVEANLLAGCQSRVWLLMEGDKQAMHIRANSDAAIVAGLIALLIRAYSGAAPDAILASEPFFVRELGLSQHLSPTRANGLNAMLTAIRARARDLAGPGCA